MGLDSLACSETIKLVSLDVKHIVGRIACSIITGFWFQKYMLVHVKPAVLPLVAIVNYTDNKGVIYCKYIKYTFLRGVLTIIII